MSGRAPRYEQVATSEGTAASSLPAARTWSARGNLWKMFIALIVVVGVYVSFTLVREQAAIGASSDDGNPFFAISTIVSAVGVCVSWIVCLHCFVCIVWMAVFRLP